MTFDETKKRLNEEMDFDKWFTRYKHYDKYVFMGCEGRIMIRAFWKDSDYFISSNCLTRQWFENKTIFPKDKLIFISKSDNLPFADKKTNDLEVINLFPSQQIKLNFGEKCYWGK